MRAGAGVLAERKNLPQVGNPRLAIIVEDFRLGVHPRLEVARRRARQLIQQGSGDSVAQSFFAKFLADAVDADLAGSLGGGGRYDNLVGMFSGENVPASGISLGLERILVVMGERQMFPPAVVSTPADVMVVQWFANRTELYLGLATELRAAGLRVELYPESPTDDGKKVGDRQFKYASARGIPFVAVIGADELANDTVTVKNMKTGQQVTVPRTDVRNTIVEPS